MKYNIDDKVEFMEGTKKVTGIVLDKSEHEQAFKSIDTNEYEAVELQDESISIVGHQRMKKVNCDLEICFQCEQEDSLIDEGVCSHCDSLNRKNDFEARDGTITVTKDNIHLYYEFMINEDRKNHSDILNPLLYERVLKLDRVLFSPDTKIGEKNKYTIINKIESLFSISLIAFGVEDTLKPIDEYIEDIKASSEYKEYFSKVA